MEFEVDAQFTRAQIQDLLDVPEERRGGDWDTGYTRFDNELFVFCNVDSSGRTGHDYPNRWDGQQLVWSAKNRSNISQPLMRAISDGSLPAHIFHRSADRSPFTYAGRARASQIEDTTPVVVHWSFDLPPAQGLTTEVSRDVLREELVKAGFDLAPSGVKTQRVTRGPTTLYIKVDSNRSVLVVGPSFEEGVTALLQIPGVQRANRNLFYHNSTMRAFPKRLWSGKAPIPYGIDFGFTSQQAFRRFIQTLEGVPIAPSTDSADQMDIDPRTETEAMRAVRLGQQNFRRDLLDVWGARCALTGLAIPELLRASHIKPWCDATSTERLDPNNGLLLAVHMDGLFDRGFISFDEHGLILISDKLSQESLKCFGLTADLKIDGLTPQHQSFLNHHRERFGFA
ncbi:HNH endonuclease [Tardiphaga sp. 71_E8_N1_1]|uniref:HNH endonuclease n=1 Tax=Tardiphaga sp. 71_E8_N1_1 TaxID=3240784 RepID=UPI003F89F1B7